MKARTAIGMVLLLVGSAVGVSALSDPNAALTKDSAALVRGGEIFPDRQCLLAVATCTWYAYGQGVFPSCPNPPTQVCGYCELPGAWDNCVSKIGTTCESVESQHACGKQLIGVCSGANCVNGMWNGQQCPAAPGCRNL